MSHIGIIGGTGFKDCSQFEIENKIEEHTSWGTPSSALYEGTMGEKEVILLLRHGPDHNIPPHRINHRANIYAMQERVEEIIGVCSAGALDPDIEVPSISAPADYVNFWDPPTFYDEKIKHVTPELSLKLRKQIIQSSEELGIDLTSEDLVYVQTRGPRLETKAEVRILSNFGDLVGMTMASEATLCKECDVDYAGIVTIDNYANGIKDETVEYDEIVETAKNRSEDVLGILERFLKKR